MSLVNQNVTFGFSRPNSLEIEAKLSFYSISVRSVKCLNASSSNVNEMIFKLQFYL
jgi:hypothetical protein